MSEVAATREVRRERAGWMRTVGAAVMRELALPLYEKQPEFLGPQNFTAIEHHARHIEAREGLDLTIARAYALSMNTFKAPQGNIGPVPYNDEIERQVAKYTFMDTSPMSFAEGMQSQQFTPLNLMRVVSAEADRQGVAGFKMATLTDIASILKRNDFRTLIDDAAFTRNGIWRDFTSQISHKYDNLEGPALDVVFNDEGIVSFRPEFRQFLRQQLAEVNHQDRKDVDIHMASSSGCPAAHKGPRFTNSAKDKAHVALLSDHFKKTPEQITQQRDQSIIHDGLDRLALVLEAADHYLQTGEVYKPKRPNGIRRLAQKAIGFVRSGWKRI